MDDFPDECAHGLTVETCGSCRKTLGPKRPGPTPTASPDEPWAPYANRFAARPETLAAYVDVWKRSSAARSFSGGWSTFSRAASAEPAIDPGLVREAERLMEQYGYVSDGKRPGVGRRWWRSVG